MLGIIHRTVLGSGPAQFRSFFAPDERARREGLGKHRLQLKVLEPHESDFRLPHSRPAEYIERSALGLTRVYNKLPASIVEASATVSSFQSALQQLVLCRAHADCADWELTLSPRVPSWRHPLNDVR